MGQSAHMSESLALIPLPRVPGAGTLPLISIRPLDPQPSAALGIRRSCSAVWHVSCQLPSASPPPPPPPMVLNDSIAAVPRRCMCATFVVGYRRLFPMSLSNFFFRQRP